MKAIILIAFIFFLKKILMFIFESEKDKSVRWGGTEWEGDTDSEAGSRLWAVSTEPDMGLRLANGEIMTWAKVERSTDWATQAPLDIL